MKPAVSGVLASLLLAGSVSAHAQSVDRTNLWVDQVVAPANAVAGESVRVEARFHVSAAPTATFRFRVLLTTNGATSGGVDLGTFGPVTVTPSSPRIVPAIVTVPTDASGRLQFAVQVDPTNAVSERNEYDNVDSARDFTRVRVRAPDLQVGEVRLSRSQLRVLEPLTVNYRVVNGGERPGSARVAAFISDNGAVSSDDVELAGETVTLAPGETFFGALDAVVPAGLIAGDYTVAVIADPDLTLTEVEEANNVSAAPRPLNVFADTLEVTTTSLPGGTVFLPYHAQLTAVGGDGAHVYSITSGELPTGLRLDPTTGLIGGTPRVSGEFALTVAVTSNGLSDQAQLTLTTSESGVDLEIITPSLGRGTVSLSYQARLAVAGGEPAYTWTVIDGALPPGLDLSTAGGISGRPTTQGRFNFSIQVEDGRNNRDAAEFTIDIDVPSVAVVTGRLAPVPVAAEMEVTLEASGGKPPYTWRARSALPPGLSLTEDGVLSGTPTTIGDFRLLVEAEESSSVEASDTGLLLLTVEETGTFEIVLDPFVTVSIREELVYPLRASGGTPPYTWRLVPGDGLPNGFVLQTGDDAPPDEAVVRGAAIRPLLHGFGVQVTDAAGRERQAIVQVQVVRPPGFFDSGCVCVDPRAPRDGASSWGLLLVAGAAIAARRRRR